MKFSAEWGAARTARYRAHLATPEQIVLQSKREAVAAICESKQWFPSEYLARRIRDEVAQRKPGIAETEPCKCPHCRKWHLGHTPLSLIAERAEAVE